MTQSLLSCLKQVTFNKQFYFSVSKLLPGYWPPHRGSIFLRSSSANTRTAYSNRPQSPPFTFFPTVYMQRLTGWMPRNLTLRTNYEVNSETRRPLPLNRMSTKYKIRGRLHNFGLSCRFNICGSCFLTMIPCKYTLYCQRCTLNLERGNISETSATQTTSTQCHHPEQDAH
jgi:hypothetical protein